MIRDFNKSNRFANHSYHYYQCMCLGPATHEGFEFYEVLEVICSTNETLIAKGYFIPLFDLGSSFQVLVVTTKA